MNKRSAKPLHFQRDFHTLDWLTYGNLMLGRFDDARANVELARAAAERNPTNAGIRDSYLAMRGRYLLETEQWDMAESAKVIADRVRCGN